MSLDTGTSDHDQTMATMMVSNRIECADYRDFLASIDADSIDLVLTDPPYTISRKTGFSSVVNGVQRFAVSMDFGAWDAVQIDLNVMAAAFYRVLRRGGTAIVWYDLWKIGELKSAMEGAGFKMLRQIHMAEDQPCAPEYEGDLPIQQSRDRIGWG